MTTNSKFNVELTKLNAVIQNRNFLFQFNGNKRMEYMNYSTGKIITPGQQSSDYKTLY